jgi:hypothetical protein
MDFLSKNSSNGILDLIVSVDTGSSDKTIELINMHQIIGSALTKAKNELNIK